MAARLPKPRPSSNVGKTLQPEAVVILYHQRSGAIAHTHFFSAANGARLPDKDKLEHMAFGHAEKDGCNVRMHKALHVDPATLKRGTGYRVSPAKRALVEVKASRQRPRSPRA
jgi:hypothetical protein